MRHSLILLWLTVVCAGQHRLAAAGAEQLALKWSALNSAIKGSKIALVLPSGTHIEGRVQEVQADGLHLRVSKTSDRRAMPKGDRIVPRASVSLVRLTEHRKLGRILCTLGAVAVAGAVVAAQDIDVYEGPAVVIVPAVTAAGVIGAGVGGYFIGKRLDKRVTDIRIVPD